MAKFCSTVVRMVSLVKRRTMSAKRAQLIGGDVAQRKRNGNRDVTGLALRANIELQPTLEVFGIAIQIADGNQLRELDRFSG